MTNDIATAATHEDHARRISTIGPTILLSTGRYFDFTNPEPLSIEEVAHSLSHLCRYNGHCKQFYSVAQHSVIVSTLLPPDLQLWGLLHDAVEAVVGDMAGPLKRLIPEYKAIENRCEAVILAGFGLQSTMPPEVKRADLIALRTEQRDLMHKEGGLWTCLDGIEPSQEVITAWPAEVARSRFIAMYRSLTNSAMPWPSDAEIDKHLDAVLRAMPPALRHYTMQKSRDDMRTAMRQALQGGAA